MVSLLQKKQKQVYGISFFIYGIFASKETEASIWYFKDREACNAEGRPVHNPPATVKTNGHTTNYPLLYTMMHLMDQYYNYCHLDKYFSDTYEKKYPLMDQYYCHPDKYFSDTYEKIPKEEVVTAAITSSPKEAFETEEIKQQWCMIKFFLHTETCCNELHIYRLFMLYIHTPHAIDFIHTYTSFLHIG